MKIKILFLLFAFFIQNSNYACGGVLQRVYAGNISYSVSPSNPLNCSVVIALNFDISDSLPTDSIYVDWGDGNQSPIYASVITPDSIPYAVNGAPVLYNHVYEGKHTYGSVSSTGYYIISPIFQYRLNFTNNIINGQPAELRFYVAAQVILDTTVGFINNSPVLSPAEVAFAYTNTTFNQSSSFYDGDGDSVAFDLLTPLVGDSIEAPQYLFPNDYCQNMGQSSSLSINHTTGEISWSAPCQQGIFAVTQIARKYRNGRLLGSIMSDQNIVVTAATDISSYSMPKSIQLYPNPANSMLRIETSLPSSIIISDILGKPVMKLSIQTSTDIDISALSNGVYFLRDDKNTFTKKFVKQ